MVTKQTGTSQGIFLQDILPVKIYAPFRSLGTPLIVIGMHRSGTSLVASLLALLGVYMGGVGDPQEESKLFVHLSPQQSLIVLSKERGSFFAITQKRIREGYAEDESFRLVNEQLFRSAGADWNFVEPLLARKDDPAFTKSCIRLLQRATYKTLRTQYLAGMPHGYSGPWGWKDPRNSLTLKYWLHLFPNAKVLHVRRNPDAVVRSLMRRAEAEAFYSAAHVRTPLKNRIRGALADPRFTLQRYRWKIRGVVNKGIYTETEWRQLYDLYVAECEKWRVLGERYKEVEYETLLAHSQEVIASLANFAEVEVNDAIIRQAVSLILPPESKRW